VNGGAPASVHEVSRASAVALSEAYALLAQWGREARERQATDPPPERDRDTTSVAAPAVSRREGR